MAKPPKKQKSAAPIVTAPAPASVEAAEPARAPARTARWKLLIGIAAALALACVLIYAQTRDFDFINYDDMPYVVNNEHVNRGFTAEGLGWAFFTVDYYYWQPLTWLSHMLDCQLFGVDPGRHHVVNVAWHVLNTVLLLCTLYQLTGAVWRSAFATALFALHPLRVESVAWIAERKDVVSGFFWILTILFYGLSVKRRRQPFFALMVMAFCGAVMSKPSVVTLPFVLLLLDYWPLGRLRWPDPDWRSLLREKAPLFAIAGVVSLITYSGQSQMGATVSLKALPFWFRIWNAVVSYARYLGKMVWPVDLGILYPYGRIPGLLMLSCLLLLLAITGFVVWRRRRERYLIVGWLWFVGVLFPVSGLAQSGTQAMADRFTYLPMIGLAIAVSWGVAGLVKTFRVPVVAAVIAGVGLSGVLAWASWRQTQFWSDSFTLFHHTIRVTRDNDFLNLNLAGLYEKRGDLEQAMKHLKEAVRIEPTNYRVYYLIGNIEFRLRQYDRATVSYQASIRGNPNDVEARKALAEALLRSGRRQEAKEQLERVVKLAPWDAEAKGKLVMLTTPF